MITFLRGTLNEVADDAVVLDVDGVGYNVSVPPICLDELRPPRRPWSRTTTCSWSSRAASPCSSVSAPRRRGSSSPRSSA